MTVQIRIGNCLEILRLMPTESVQCNVSSPPYWGLRDYQIEPSIWGGDEDCSHEWGERPRKHNANSIQGPGSKGKNVDYGGFGRGKTTGPFCVKCNAWKGALGLEPTPELFVDHMVEVYEEVRRVLRPDGIAWVNIGDCYASGGGARDQGRAGDRFERAHTQKYPGVNRGSRSLEASGKHGAVKKIGSNRAQRGDGNGGVPFAPMEAPNRSPLAGLKAKDLVGVPWMLAFALRRAGWYLRQDIVWQKPNPMPESTEDRCTKAHEYVFLLSKSEQYFYDAEAIKEESSENSHPRRAANGILSIGPKSAEHGIGIKANSSFHAAGGDLVSKRNKRSVWTVATRPFPGAHFATFPPELIEPCVLAGTSERGACSTCRSPWARVSAPTARYAKFLGRSHHDHRDDDGKGQMQQRGQNRQNEMIAEGIVGKETETIGWYPSCWCDGLQQLPPLPPTPRLVAVDPDDPTPEEEAAHEVAREGWRVACTAVHEARRRLCEPAAKLRTVPCVVLDHFGGAGTTGLVADRAQRDAILIEMNPTYVAMAERRIFNDAPLFSGAAE